MPSTANPSALLQRAHMLGHPVSRAKQISRRCAFWLDMRLQPQVTGEISWTHRGTRLRWIAENYLALRGLAVASELSEFIAARSPGVLVIDEACNEVLATLASQTPVVLVTRRARGLMGLALRDLKLTAAPTHCHAVANRACEKGFSIVFTARYGELARKTAQRLNVPLTHLSDEYFGRQPPRRIPLLALPASYGG